MYVLAALDPSGRCRAGAVATRDGAVGLAEGGRLLPGAVSGALPCCTCALEEQCAWDSPELLPDCAAGGRRLESKIVVKSTKWLKCWKTAGLNTKRPKQRSQL